jgi:predicted DNA-binding ribbon-helix-helix protein
MEISRPHQVEREIHASDAKLKIIQQKGKKYAIRLEIIFWSQLTEFAKEDKTTLSRLIFKILDTAVNVQNRTSHLRCYCIDRMRKKQPLSALIGPAFDMLAFVSACPNPVAIVTGERRLVAFNPSFSAIIRDIQPPSREPQRAINLSFSEPFPKIQKQLVDHPTDIKVYQLGLQVGTGQARQFRARFALAEREKGASSLVAIFLEN